MRTLGMPSASTVDKAIALEEILQHADSAMMPNAIGKPRLTQARSPVIGGQFQKDRVPGPLGLGEIFRELQVEYEDFSRYDFHVCLLGAGAPLPKAEVGRDCVCQEWEQPNHHEQDELDREEGQQLTNKGLGSTVKVKFTLVM